MPPLIEPLHRGLVDAPDPSTLSDGELTLADDCYYPIAARTLTRFPGRTLTAKFDGTLPLSGTGLFHLTFDDADAPVFVIRHADSISAFVKGAADTYAELETSPPDLSAGGVPVVAHYANTHYLFDGGNPAQVLRENLVAELDAGKPVVLDRMGMRDVTEAPFVELRSDAGDGDFHSTGTFWYLVTEFDIDEDLESGTTAEPVQIGVLTTAGNSVVVTRPAILNTRATHWLVYRAESTVKPGLNQFVRVAVVDVSEEQFVDDDGTGGSADSFDATLDATNLTGTNWAWLERAVDGDDFTSAITFELGSEGAMHVDDVWSTAEQGDLDAGLPVTGIEIITRCSGIGEIAIGVSPDGGATWLRAGTFAGGGFPPDADWVTLTSIAREVAWGGELNPWYVLDGTGGRERYSWQAGDFANGQFRIRIFLAAISLPNDGTLRLAINEFKRVRVYVHGQAVNAAPTGEFFPTLPIALPGSPLTAVSPANGPPPEASSTATVFEGSLVLNDVADSSRLVWSQADAPETFPPVYFLNIETPDRDEVRALWGAQDWLFVGLSRSIFRVNYLPTESDLAFDRGRALSVVDTQHGVVGPRALTSLSLDGLPSLVAFVDRYQGLVGCDGHRTYPLTQGLDWQAKVAPEHLHRAILVNYAPWQALVLYYVPRGGDSLSRALIFHYSPIIRRGASVLTVTGPCRLTPNVGVTLARDGDLVEGYALGRDFRLWQEFGADDEAKVGLAMRVRSRVFFPLGLGQEARAERTYVRYRDLSGCQIRITQDSEVVGGTIRKPVQGVYDRPIERNERGHIRLDLDGMAEAFQLELAAVPESGHAEDYRLGLDHFAWWVAGYGREG